MQRTIVVPYIDGLYRYAMSITRNPTDAEDLVQETYVRAIRAMGSLGAGSNHKSWLFTILRNLRLLDIDIRYWVLGTAPEVMPNILVTILVPEPIVGQRSDKFPAMTGLLTVGGPSAVG